MIKSFRCKETSKIWAGKYSKRFPRDIQERALVKLRLIDAALSFSDLKVPPGNRLEVLSGDRTGQYSIRVNRQWRICFEWRDGSAESLEIVDYH
jgi:proteic killer suppression protein